MSLRRLGFFHRANDIGQALEIEGGMAVFEHQSDEPLRRSTPGIAGRFLRPPQPDGLSTYTGKWDIQVPFIEIILIQEIDDILCAANGKGGDDDLAAAFHCLDGRSL
jgi:hypothetical protein